MAFRPRGWDSGHNCEEFANKHFCGTNELRQASTVQWGISTKLRVSCRQLLKRMTFPLCNSSSPLILLGWLDCTRTVENRVLLTQRPPFWKSAQSFFSKVHHMSLDTAPPLNFCLPTKGKLCGQTGFDSNQSFFVQLGVYEFEQKYTHTFMKDTKFAWDHPKNHYHLWSSLITITTHHITSQYQHHEPITNPLPAHDHYHYPSSLSSASNTPHFWHFWHLTFDMFFSMYKVQFKLFLYT